MHVKKTR